MELAQILYVPPPLGGIAFYLAVFALLIPLQAYLGIRHRFFEVMFVSLVLEILGYASRVRLHYNPFEWQPFVM